MKNTSKKLLEKTKEIWEEYYTHPFTMGIADETLDIEKFKFYMIQDYLYLIDYAKVFALGVAKSDDMQAAKRFAKALDLIYNGEMDIHRGYMKRLGISLEEAENTPVAIDNASYTSYMLKVAYEQGIAEIAVAILSCAVSYEYIARNIVKNNPDSVNNEFYGEWIRGYANDEYAAENRELEELVDKIAADYTEEQTENLIDIFVKCSRYEKMFWDMSWEMKL